MASVRPAQSSCDSFSTYAPANGTHADTRERFGNFPAFGCQASAILCPCGRGLIAQPPVLQYWTRLSAVMLTRTKKSYALAHSSCHLRSHGQHVRRIIPRADLPTTRAWSPLAIRSDCPKRECFISFPIAHSDYFAGGIPMRLHRRQFLPFAGATVAAPLLSPFAQMLTPAKAQVAGT